MKRALQAAGHLRSPLKELSVGLAAPQAPGSFAILRAPLAVRRVLNRQSLLR
jgi:hypothetical protein